MGNSYCKSASDKTEEELTSHPRGKIKSQIYVELDIKKVQVNLAQEDSD